MTETNAVVQRLTPSVRPSRVSQATSVEQSRAVAQVHAAMLVAQQAPRDVEAAIRAMESSCRRPELAERAFFRFKRGGATVAGPSIHLARELARCWGNVDHGIAELSQDREAGQSEMVAFAWDLEANVRGSNTFVVPHVRDARGEQVALVDVRDVYENNANLGARRLREMIFSVLPPWFVETAKDLCMKTLENGGGIPIEQRRTKCITGFDEIGVSRAQLEERVGRPVADWTVHDVVLLGQVFTSICRSEVRVADEFPPPRVTDADIAEQAERPVQRAPRREPKTAPVTVADGDPAAGIDPTLEPGFGEPRG